MLKAKVLDFICQKVLEIKCHFLLESTCRLQMQEVSVEHAVFAKIPTPQSKVSADVMISLNGMEIGFNSTATPELIQSILLAVKQLCYALSTYPSVNIHDNLHIFPALSCSHASYSAFNYIFVLY